MDPSIDIAETATCTTCRFVEDKSNYWTAVLYFKARNGTFIRVPQMANHNTGPGIAAGGMTVYYFQPNPPTKDLKVTAFAKGFRMIVGHPLRRADDIDPTDPGYRATSFRCFKKNDPGNSGTPGYPGDTFHLPNEPCEEGIRSNIYFPQCWDGVNLDTPDHSSHVAHPVGTISPEGLQFFGTDCPASHPVRLPLLFIEINWDTRAFNDLSLWPEDGSQPFVFSMGDPTGYGQHADYVFGWEGDSLQRAMDVCTGFDGIPTNCPVLTVQDTDSMNKCRQANKVEEVVEDAYLNELPGCNPIQEGPQSATMPASCGALSTWVAAPSPTTPPAVVTPPWPVCHDGPGTHPLAPNCDSIPTKAPGDAPTEVPAAIITPV
ncbi:hypothetical protein CC1G_15244 [Coprinopsis cinerea okayama7|uniref:DUF1996 domain-containing protein n=1 Tax=Coprinopsis cinerea (strain Okayama-7 / 130 / ATCC MYA-4618 / FGSC 9003) TaxID=240176 RepID=D6RQ69_COPC7|nr:hypothetical protein CC1G_15244 [Coprinopsis cinerea okayama7\|eukprot:XP_002910336.1 hypothetical protein CC1G_15244 [Coprinopsis cinerea okayama7\